MPNVEELRQHARDIAGKHTISKGRRYTKGLFIRIQEDNRILVHAYKTTNEEVKAKRPILPAAEWLLDNFYVIEEQVKEILTSIPKKYYNELPILEDGKFKGFPRIYAIAGEMVDCSHGRIDEDTIDAFITEYQKVSPLTGSELWALPLMLRIALIQEIRSIINYILKSQKERKEAESWAQRLLEALDGSAERLQELIGEHDKKIGYMTPDYGERLLQILRDHGSDAAPIIRWVDGKLAVQHTGADEIIQTAHQNQAAYQLSMGNSITSLRLISGLNWEEIFESLSIVEKILNQDPEGVYPAMEFASRDYYRQRIEKLSKRFKITEIEVAEKAIECALDAQDNANEDSRTRHVGFYLLDKGYSHLIRKLSPGKGDRGIKDTNGGHHYEAFYLGAVLISTFVILGLFVYGIYVYQEVHLWWELLLAAVIAFIPILSICIGIVHWIITNTKKPCHLPKLELKDGIPEEYRTMVIIPTLLTNEKRVAELIEQMEVFYLANQEENLHFALVGDFKDGPREHNEDDKIIIDTAIKSINRLNERYGSDRQDIFFYFHRHRQWNTAQKSWMGWERKRGAIEEFNHLLKGNSNTSYSTQVGDLSVLPKIKYVITLDADTQLPRDAAKRLIGTMVHPLNRPVFNEANTRVVEGYGLLQPRIGVSVDSASRSFFALIFSGQTGIDPYTTAVSDVYQDLFCEGIFTGKGIYDVDVFHTALNDTIPENSILSHDLLEGSYVKAGLVTDIELVDGYPANYIAYTMRLHRWVRGDWQLFPWLFSKVKNKKGERIKNPLSLMSKWKILDNLRRSLLSPALFILLVLSVTVLPGPLVGWLGLAFITLVFPLATELAGTMVSRYHNPYGNNKLSEVLHGARSVLWQIVLSFVFLAHQAYMMLDAVIRTLIRVYVTRRNMLEWVTAADADRKFKGSQRDFWTKMSVSVWIAVVFFIVVIVFFTGVWPVALLFSVSWTAAPWVAYNVSRPKGKKIPKLSEEQILNLRKIARSTWKYFDRFISSEDNYLPPDNYQEDPPLGIAHRTSPTNIGMGLMAVLAARDFGYIGMMDTVNRLERIINSINRLDKWQGHFYNWYNTITLEPLRPLYVSSVDNGNLVGYLITLKQGIEDALKDPLISRGIVMGLKDTLMDYYEMDMPEQGMINMLLSSDTISLTEWKMVLDDLKEQDDGLKDIVSKYEKDIEAFVPWIELIAKIPSRLVNEKGAYRHTARKIIELLNKLNGSVSLYSLVNDYHEILAILSEALGSLKKEGHKTNGYHEARAWLKDMELSLARSHAFTKGFIERCMDLNRQMQLMIKDMDFGVLYSKKRELLSIGYNVEEGKLTNSYYDLLASEARQASFIAIAKGDIPQKHWFKLGRALTMVGDQRALLSWSGTMFEYMMPLLIMKNYDYTLLDETYTAVVKGQKQYGEQRHVPWGFSESAFYAFDLQLNYQYKAFGIPQLGLKRGLVNDVVVSPYSSVLALPVDPVGAVKNIEQLILEGMEGEYGLYEAIDYTPERMPKRKKSMIVKNYMVHHQGMSLLALDNYLNNNIMQSRFHRVPMIKATELLLQERMPKKEIFIKEFEEEITELETNKQQEIRARRSFTTEATPWPETHLLSNGSYSVMLTNSGGGYSQFQGTAISRWREDPTRDNWGMYFYIYNLNSNDFWSATYQPCGVHPEDYNVIFEPDRVIYNRNDGNIETKTEVVVSPEYNGEVRRISLSNHSEYERVMEVTSYYEVVLASQAADIAHPAFSNLFVETQFLAEYNALLATRRPRDKEQKSLWLVHTLALEGNGVGGIQYETDRSKFIGRGRNPANPQVMDPEYPLSNTVGPVLDPVMSLRKRVAIPPGETAKIIYITAIAETREAAIAIAREYQSHAVASRAYELAWTHSQVELRYLNMTAGQANLYQNMASHIIYTGIAKRLREEFIRNNTKGQTALWAYGISGDLPIVILKISKLEQMDMAKQVLTAHEYWRLKGLQVDLVIFNEYGNSYEQPVQDRLRDIISVSHARDLQDKPGGVFLRQANLIPAEDKGIMYACARLVLSGDKGAIISQMEFKKNDVMPPLLKKSITHEHLDEPCCCKVQDLTFFNEMGGFSPDGKEYVIQIWKDHHTPVPWSNIVANEDLGFMVTESGSSYTWSKNSRENKLTPWSNDPVADPSGEIIYLRNEESGYFWTITPLPIREASPYIVRHGFGYSEFEHISNGINQNQIMFVPLNECIKICLIRVKNTTNIIKKLSITHYIEWVLGINSQNTRQYIMTDKDNETAVYTAYNRYNEEFGHRIAFMGTNLEDITFTGDREEFLGRNSSIVNPKALERECLSGRFGAGYDPCGAIQGKFELNPGEEKEIILFMGQGSDIEEVRNLANKYRNMNNVKQALTDVKNFWEHKLGVVQVKTPDKSMDLMLNGWLLYQTFACRLMARTAFYQAGGAYGFRDQLQDVMALALCAPEKIKEQVVRCAEHQFLEGDVQHWWHPPYRGVRTRITDDLLFMPYVVTEYLNLTKDYTLLEEEAYYIEDDELAPNEHDRYNIPRVSQEKGDIYDHCVRAIERSLRFGEHGLPLIGGGDWNDGMDKVGIEGKGESVWLAWFQYTTIMRFIPVCEYRGDYDRASRYKKVAEELKDNIEKNGWDGGWYRRAYFDDGTPLGSEKNIECRIDSISQSWGVISGAGKKSRVIEAMRAVEHYLVQREDGLIKLLTPPFNKTDHEPGYIKGYLPGVRENGGQYTHAAVWTVMAFAKLGYGDKAWELYRLINPVNHARSWIDLWKYKVEPYVTAADVYAVTPHVGRGGWTWYTGSSSWMYRVGLEWILGFRKNGENLIVDPCIPEDWSEYSITYRYNDTVYNIRVENPKNVNKGVRILTLDGESLADKKIPLADDGKTHEVIVTMGAGS